MRNLKFLIILLVLFGGMISVKAKSIEKVSVEKVMWIKNKPNKVFVHNGKKYHFRNGTWYVKKNRRFIAVRPPVGIAIRTLPRGTKVVHINGRKLYKYNNVRYKKNGRNFVVVNI